MAEICNKVKECAYKNVCPSAKEHEPTMACKIICRRAADAKCVPVEKGEGEDNEA